MITVITESVNNIYMTASHVYFAYEQELNDLDYTIIHKVFVWRTYIVPFADARLRGSINNQFNFDEYAGFILRATTTNKSGPFPSINIYCLDYFLRRMSNILFAFPNHSITSTRFVGRKVFIGTNQGPFIVGAFPSHYLPQIYGSLNLDGFSRFIFPYQ